MAIVMLCAIPVSLCAQAKPKRDVKKDNIVSNKSKGGNGVASIRKHTASKARSKSTARKRTSQAVDYDTYSRALERKAESGDMRAISTVAFAYLYGDGVEQDGDKALHFFEKGADKGNADMMTIAGILLENRDRDTEAFNRYQQAYSAGSPWGAYRLSLCYIGGTGTSVNYSFGKSLLIWAADHELADAEELLGRIYLDGSDNMGITQNTLTGMRYLERAANKDDDDALFDLGRIYLYGQYGYNADGSKAYSYLKKAADLGHGDAMDLLGDMYRFGIYVTKDNSQAFDWYQKSVEAGSSEGQADLGNAYYLGDIVPQNYEEAVNNLSQSASNGIARAQFDLGLCYEDGYFVKQDMNIAMNMYAKAALNGLNAAMSRYGLYLSSFSRSGQTDYDWFSFELFRQAAKGGETWGMFYLGRSLFEGVGHSKDIGTGIYWIRKAAENNDQLAINYIKENNLIANSLSDYQGQSILNQTTGNEQHASNLLSNFGKDNEPILTNNPTYSSSASAKIESIYRNDYVTFVLLSIKSTSRNDGYAINRNIHIIVDGKEYGLMGKDGVNFAPDWTYFNYIGEERQFVLAFSPIPHDAKTFNLIEGNGAYQWNFYNVECTQKQ